MSTTAPMPGARTNFGAVKIAIHRKLIQKLNLTRLNEIKREDVRREVGQILESLVVGESTPMSLQEREQFVGVHAAPAGDGIPSCGTGVSTVAA